MRRAGPTFAIALPVIVFFGTACASSVGLTPTELATWPRMRATDFGCMLERRFGVKDSRFDCAADFDRIDWGSACRVDDANNYYAGPKLPRKVIATLLAPIESVAVDWEGGRLQAVSIDFRRTMSRTEVEALLGIRLDGPNADNLMSASLQDCAPGKSCVVLQGFDHMGAADVDCDPAPSTTSRTPDPGPA